MLLGPYANPPYRDPTSKAPPSSPPQDPSPKRKRTESSGSLQVNTQLHVDDSHGTGSDSPRTKVAEKLQDLDLQQSPSTFRDAVDGHAVRRKRIKRQPVPNSRHESRQDVYSDRVGPETPDTALPALYEQPLGLPESGKMPEYYPPPSSSATPLRKAPDSLPSDRTMSVIPRVERPPNETLLSTPPSSSEGRAHSPLPSGDDLSPNQAALTWQDDEITGHELDPSAEDDGEGINGIGFRPTPAIAYARQQRRKQQVNEWKAREARDARQRRIERRRGGTCSSSDSVEAEFKRMVRFADI